MGDIVVASGAAAAFVVAGGGCRHADDHVGAGTVVGTAAVDDP